MRRCARNLLHSACAWADSPTLYAHCKRTNQLAGVAHLHVGPGGSRWHGVVTGSAAAELCRNDRLVSPVATTRHFAAQPEQWDSPQALHGTPAKAASAFSGMETPSEESDGSDNSLSRDNRKALQHFMHSKNSEGAFQAAVEKVNEYVQMALEERKAHTGPGDPATQFAIDQDIVKLYVNAELSLMRQQGSFGSDRNRNKAQNLKAVERLERILQNLHAIHIKTRSRLFDKSCVALFRTYFEACALSNQSKKAGNAFEVCVNVSMADVVTDPKSQLLVATAYVNEATEQWGVRIDDELFQKATEMLRKLDTNHRLSPQQAKLSLELHKHMLIARVTVLSKSDHSEKSLQAFIAAWHSHTEAVTALSKNELVNSSRFVDPATCLYCLTILSDPKLRMVNGSHSTLAAIDTVIQSVELLDRAHPSGSGLKADEGMMLDVLNRCVQEKDARLAERTLALLEASLQRPYRLSASGAADRLGRKAIQKPYKRDPEPASYLAVIQAWAEQPEEEGTAPDAVFRRIFDVVGRLSDAHASTGKFPADCLDPGSSLIPAVKRIGASAESWALADKTLEEIRQSGGRVCIAQYNILVGAVTFLDPVLDEAGKPVQISDPGNTHHMHKSINLMDRFGDLAATDAKQRHLTPDTHTFNAILACMRNSNFLSGVSAVLSEMKTRDVPRDSSTFHLLLSFFLKNNQFQGFVLTLEEMRDEGFRPDARILSHALEKARQIGELGHVEALQKEMSREGLKFSESTRAHHMDGNFPHQARSPPAPRRRLDERGRYI